MSTEWITDVLRDLIRFAQQNRLARLARDLEQTLQGLEEENTRRAALPDDRPSPEEGEAKAPRPQ